MSDCVDDRTPLLQPFVRGSSLRTPVRLYKAPPDIYTQNPIYAPNCKPPLPPRPAEWLQRRPLLRRSHSVNEGERKETQIPHFSHVPAQQVLGAEEWRAPAVLPPLHRNRIAPATGDATAVPQRDAYGRSEENHPRNGYPFASMPRFKRTHHASPPPPSSDMRRLGMSTFRRGPPSPSPSRRAATPTDERTSARKERSYDSKLPTFSDNSFLRRFCRSGRSQTPPPPCPSPSPLRSPVTYRREIPVPQSPDPFRRYGSVPMKKSEYPPHPGIGDAGGRSSSFRHPRLERTRYSAAASQLPVLSSHLTMDEKYPLLDTNFQRYGTTDDGQGGGWSARTPPPHRRDLPHVHPDWQRTHYIIAAERRDPRRFSYLRMPESQTQSHVSTALAGDLPASSTTSCSLPTSPRPPRSLDMDDRSSTLRSWERSHSGALDSDDLGVGPQRRIISSPSLSLCRVSSDSGYSTCSNSSAASRSDSVVSDSEGDMIAWFGSRLNLRDEESLATKSATDHFSYLMEKEEEYLVCLRSILRDYQDMNSKTPSLIRQHFDLIFKQVEVIYAFQMALQDSLTETRGQPEKLARVFTNEQFQCYSRYMVMTPAVQRDLLQYASHFKEHFPDLKRNILKPSLRINFYAMILDSFKKEASQEVKSKLQEAIDYLNQVKRKANTEMTLNTVIHSPVDLRLGGDMLYIGELNYIGGGTLQKKKYQLILFENLLVITSMKPPYFKYKTHYRVEQLESVVASGDNELHLNVLSEGQTQLATLKFRIKSTKIRDEWISELQKITRRNTKLTQGRGSVSKLQIPRQQFRTLPLDLSRVFPLLKEVVMDDAAGEAGREPVDGYSLPNMNQYEEMYVNKLSSLLNPEIQRPPEALGDLLEKLHRLHSKKFLPALQRSQKVSDFADYLAENLEELQVYIDYLVVRSQLTVKLDEEPQAGPYICPVQHVYGIYFGFMKELCTSEKCKKSAQRVMRRLREDIDLAQIRVLKEAIVNGRVDFQRSGILLLSSPMEVKTRKKEIRAGEYIALLFENVIILTRPKQPYYEYVMDIWLDQVNLGPPTNHDCTFRVEVRQGGRKEPITYEMCATSAEVKQKWMRRLHQQMLVQVAKIRERVASAGDSAVGGSR
ncbi:uncharacterized protein LOC135089275 [Scylla paramamosain]|uniref:uncharacterized protein LOC135089275 n=1 Tax=Scylla paramamosain TaxID=85552 RepID=UPI0030837EAC